MSAATATLPVSVVLITKREAANLRALLPTLGWAREIVVLDEGGDPDTEAICRDIPGLVLRQQPLADYASQRNAATAMATAPWILSLDADERVPPALVEELADVVQREEWAAYVIPMRTWFLGRWLRHGGWSVNYLIRLFRRDRARWVGSVHERLMVDGQVGRLRAPLLHFPWRDVNHLIEKTRQYTSREADAWHAAGRRGALWRVAALPGWEFLKRYVWHRGFLDGAPGFITAALMGHYVFEREVKLRSRGRTPPPAAGRSEGAEPPSTDGRRGRAVKDGLKEWIGWSRATASPWREALKRLLVWHPDTALRYEPVVEGLRRRLGRAAAVAEVGSGPVGVAAFWDGPVIGLDLAFSGPRLANQEQVQGSVLALPWPDASQEAVVCLDMLEHLPANQRQAAVREVLRVARRVAVIGCPSGPEAEACDAAYRACHGEDHPHCREHGLYGVPKDGEVLGWVEACLEEIAFLRGRARPQVAEEGNASVGVWRRANLAGGLEGSPADLFRRLWWRLAWPWLSGKHDSPVYRRIVWIDWPGEGVAP